MKTADKIAWGGFAGFVLLLCGGIIFKSKLMLGISYVAGLPFLLLPLFALQNWSERRKDKNSEPGN